MKPEPKHWFLLSYMVQHPGIWSPHSIVASSDTLELSIPKLVALRNEQNVPEASILMSVSHLGWMSDKAIQGLPDIDPPTQISPAFHEGMVAGLYAGPHDHSQPVNPYSLASEDPHEMNAANEWSAGLASVRKAQVDPNKPKVQLTVTEPTPTVPLGEKASGEVKPGVLRKPNK